MILKIKILKLKFQSIYLTIFIQTYLSMMINRSVLRMVCRIDKFIANAIVVRYRRWRFFCVVCHSTDGLH